MSLPKFNKDIQIISKLADEPNDVGGLSAEELKAKFDEASVLIKAFINDTLLPYLEGVSGAGGIGIANIPGLNDAATVQAALQELKIQLNNTSTGSIPDRSLSGEKLVTGAVGTNELANASVTSEKIANASVDDSKISSVKLSGSSIKDKSIENRHFNGKVIKAENVEDNTLTGNQMKDLSIPTVKIANGAIQTSKITDGAVTRAKLAQDALYSPLSQKTGSYTLTVNDIGKTFLSDSSSPSDVRVITLNASNNNALPIGSEFAILAGNTGTTKLTVEAGIGVRGNKDGDVLSSDGITVTIPRYCMIALKKFYAKHWFITGVFEVDS